MTPRHIAPAHTAAARAALAAMSAGAVAIVGWPVLVALANPVPPSASALVAHTSGMLAGYGVLVMLVLMSRWPALERGIGSDRIARWHGAGGRLVLTLVFVHAIAAVTVWARATGRDPLSATRDVLGMPGLVAATIGTAAMTLIAVVSARQVRARISYETWHALHLSMYVAVALSFTHQLAGPDLAGRPWLQGTWALLYTYTFALVLRHRVLAPIRAVGRHQLRVSAVVPEAPGVVSIVLTGRHLDELGAEAGNFFRWRFLAPGLWWRAHPFSLSALPTEHSLRLTVKALGSGSQRIQTVPVGTRLIAEGPYGALTAQRRTRRNVRLIAGGVGITPMRALFESLPVSADQDLTLLYRATTHADIVFRTELEALASHRRAPLIYLLGGDRNLLSPQSLRRLVPDLTDRDIYLCGPPRMAQAVRESLAAIGLPPKQLHEERFEF
jgi:predicted ferric reductase